MFPQEKEDFRRTENGHSKIVILFVPHEKQNYEGKTVQVSTAYKKERKQKSLQSSEISPENHLSLPHVRIVMSF